VSGSTRSRTFAWSIFPLRKPPPFWKSRAELLISSPQVSARVFEVLGIDSYCVCIGLGGRNRQIAEAMVKQGKVRMTRNPPLSVPDYHSATVTQTFSQLEAELLKGQKLQGPQTALEVHQFLAVRGTKRPNGYPLFDAVWRICYQVCLSYITTSTAP
jgi:glycerol-3-phosphate dehydrogenase